VFSGTVRIGQQGSTNNPAGTSKVKALIFSDPSTSVLDLTNNSMIIDYDSAGTLLSDTLQSLHDGVITTSVPTAGRSLGYGDNAQLGKATFAGQSVDSTSLLIKYTYDGDTDLDGDVDVADLGALASNWQQEGFWTAGDFDYNGTIDVNDLGMLASNWQAGVGSPLAPTWETALASVGLTNVPEPATACLLSLLAVAWRPSRGRRRRTGADA
jgi:hypothetical protein